MKTIAMVFIKSRRKPFYIHFMTDEEMVRKMLDAMLDYGQWDLIYRVD